MISRNHAGVLTADLRKSFAVSFCPERCYWTNAVDMKGRFLNEVVPELFRLESIFVVVAQIH